MKMDLLKLHKKPFKSEDGIKYEIVLYAAIFFNTLITVMNTSMFNVAIPDIIQSFRVDAQSASMIVSSYSIIFALSAILYSKLSSSIPIKWLLTVGILSFGLGSLIGMIASSYTGMIVARIIQAFGASSISALSIIVTTRYIPFQRRGRRLGLVAAAVTLGFGIGPLVGGILIELWGWRYLFGISLLSLIGFPFYFFLLPLEKRRKEKFDYTGMLLFFIGIILFLSVITYSWLWSLLLCAVLFVFYRHIANYKEPFLQPSLLKNTSFLSVMSIGFMIFFCNFSIIFLLPLLLVHVFKMGSSAWIGLTLFPGALTAVVFSTIAGRAVDRIGAKWVALTGTILMVLAGLVGWLLGNTFVLVIILIFSLSSSGFVCITTSLPNILSKILPKEQLATGIGTLQLFQYIGGGIGVTVTGKLLTYFSGMQQEHFHYDIVFGMLFGLALIALSFTFYFLKIGNKVVI